MRTSRSGWSRADRRRPGYGGAERRPRTLVNGLTGTVLGDISEGRRPHTWSAILFALPWPRAALAARRPFREQARRDRGLYYPSTCSCRQVLDSPPACAHRGRVDMRERKDKAQAVALAALPWPFLVFPLVGATLVVVNERLFHRHVFDATSLATAAALMALLGIAARVHRYQQVVPRGMRGAALAPRAAEQVVKRADPDERLKWRGGATRMLAAGAFAVLAAGAVTVVSHSWI